MSQITISNKNLPTNIEDLSKFVLIGREKLNAVRAEIRAIQKVGLAKEVYEQKQKEAQALAEAVIDAECKIGELMREIPKAQGQRTDLEPLYPTEKKSKETVLKENGFNIKNGFEMEQMSRHPEAVAEAKAEARENDEVVTRSAVLEKIKAENAALKARVENLEMRREIRSEMKSPAQIKREFIESVQQKVDDFQEKKSEGIVSIPEAQDDKHNREILANNLWARCMKLGDKLDSIAFEIKEGDVDLKEMTKHISKNDINALLMAIRSWRQSIDLIEREVNSKQ